MLLTFLFEVTISFTRQPPEKMALGALLLETENYEFWVALGCLADHNTLKQHALIRGLQLDVSLAVAWAYLGKVQTLVFLRIISLFISKFLLSFTCGLFI